MKFTAGGLTAAAATSGALFGAVLGNGGPDWMFAAALTVLFLSSAAVPFVSRSKAIDQLADLEMTGLQTIVAYQRVIDRADAKYRELRGLAGDDDSPTGQA